MKTHLQSTNDEGKAICGMRTSSRYLTQSGKSITCRACLTIAKRILPADQLGSKRPPHKFGGYPYGVYADVCVKNKHEVTLGFVIIFDGAPQTYCLKIGPTNTEFAEKLAVLIARNMFSGLDVYSDHQAAVRQCGALYINRKSNPAHKVARDPRDARLIQIDQVLYDQLWLGVKSAGMSVHILIRILTFSCP